VIRITIDDEATLDLLCKVYANRLNATSRGARYAMNSKKRAFKEAVFATAKVDGDPVKGEVVAAVYTLTLPRCDWDAPIKALQDAVQKWIGCQDDRVIRYAMAFLARPGKETRKKPLRKRQIVIDLYDATSEKERIMSRIYHLLDWGEMCWNK
jgi:hypothetical protein